ncbi:acyl-CoA synthetase [Coprinopsis cinerea okayama7|uniref:Acyl-CoA synthetase n=1 Tax=Coprinopsis cinerea (strain Okayama-7 / 130 / ATCC MYA-4618 / FGSC 9003) TaxID=240176 RepID=A8PCD7_COPC7|nr:acyl-CoA synthetase [Coprinopsis cinerea okayama7\|eukprot:XP_001840371.2 acyl-CoA synthetase [Coprinopsis cinerea okayama7\
MPLRLSRACYARIAPRALRGSKPAPKRSLSSAEGPLEPPLSNKTLPQFWRTEILEKHSTRPALIACKERPRAHGGPPSPNLGVSDRLAWDYEEFNRHIDALARGLLCMGVQKGDRVAVIMGNTSAYAMLQWACASIGAILVTINPAYRLHELVGALQLVGAKHLFAVPSIRSSHYVRMLYELFPQARSMHPGELQLEELPELKNIVMIDNANEGQAMLNELVIRSVVDWREVLLWSTTSREARLQQEIEASLDKDEVINLQFTSGTTGLPKAVSVGASCNVPPLFHCFGLVLGNLACWTHSACIVYPSEIYDPAAIVDAVSKERCTALHGVPTHFLGVLAEVEKRKKEGEKLDFTNLRTGIAAGSPIPIDLMRRLISQINLTELTVAYGMTETSPVSFQTTSTDPLLKRVETVGRIMPHVKARIVSPDGETVPIGVPGELLVSGYLLQKGYWGDAEQTEKVMKKDKDGVLWMHTGDEAVMDEEGYVRIVGRIKDIIIRGGENLFPVQIENTLTAHPSIKEAAAVSVPDSKYGEVVGAWIVREPGERPVTMQEVRDVVWKGMNPQNAPAWVWFIGEDGNPAELPKTASGKVMKHVLREWSKELAQKDVGRVQ